MGKRGPLNTLSSICWDCENCSVLTCEWVSKLIPVWREAEPREILDRDRPTTLHVVTECERFIGR